MAEYRQMSIYFDLERPDEAWAYQYLMSLRHGKKAMVITALKMMLGKGEQPVPFPARAMQPPGDSRKKKRDGRTASGRPAAESGTDMGEAAAGGAGEKQGGVLTEGEPGGAFGREPVESALQADTMPPLDGMDISAQGDRKTEPDWRTFFTQEQLAAILEKELDMSRLTGDGIRQMAEQAGSGIPVRAAYKEALMWCRQ